MQEDGICVLSGKKYYFGLGGGTQAFKDYNEKNVLYFIIFYLKIEKFCN